MRSRELTRWIEGTRLTAPVPLLAVGRCLTWLALGAALACLLLLG
jgi:hypothetical protein